MGQGKKYILYVIEIIYEGKEGNDTNEGNYVKNLKEGDDEIEDLMGMKIMK